MTVSVERNFPSPEPSRAGASPARVEPDPGWDWAPEIPGDATLPQVTVRERPAVRMWAAFREVGRALGVPLEGLGEAALEWVTRWPWVAQPQPALHRLREHAQHGGWTLSGRARTARRVWLAGPATLGRAASWRTLRGWLGEDTPLKDGDQPPLADLIWRAVDHGGPGRVWIWVVVITRALSMTWDYAGRTALAVGTTWCSLTTANELPALRAAIPDALTLRYWVEQLASPITAVAPIAGRVAMLLAAAAFAYGLLRWGGRKASTPDGDIPDDEGNVYE